MLTGDHVALMALWTASEGVILRDSDTPEAMSRFLERNPETSLVAVADGKLVGSVMAGQDGWRGYLYHLAVLPEWRRQGIGAQLVEASVAAIRRYRVPKIHCLVKCDNMIAQQFWQARGFVRRDDVLDYALECAP